jgi:arginine/lysine/ornithine decarboxylase
MGGTAVVAANCHKSVTNGLMLRSARMSFIKPTCRDMIFDAVTAEEVESALRESPHASLVIITSPTYEGEVSDVAAIAQVCHKSGVPLMVDCAHGAHFGFVPGCPEPPSRLGADITVMSLHKTLPSLTQTAAAVLCGDMVSSERFAEGLGIFESSSPSYPLLASIEKCVDFLGCSKARCFLQPHCVT